MSGCSMSTECWPELDLSASYDDQWRPESESAWWVLQTRSRQEKAVAAALQSMGISHFLPLVTAEHYHGGRKQTVVLPLFPGYVFLHGDRDATFEIDRSKRIASILPVHDQRGLHRELDSLRKAIELEAGFDPYPYLCHGSWAEVKSGPYQGVQGRVDRQTAPTKLILQVDLLQSAMAIEIDGAQLTLL
jgi:transcription termination/antitermination protein NusG